MRNYSLSNYGDSKFLRISVKREGGAGNEAPAGYASNYLHLELSEGDTIEVAAPSGDFVFDMENSVVPVLLISGGVGITPVLSMLHAAAGNGAPTTFLHGAPDGSTHAFKSEVDQLVEEHDHLQSHYRYSEPRKGDTPDSTGFLDLELIEGYLTPDTEVYFCGPKPMMSVVLSALTDLGHSGSQIHFEFFGPKEELQQCPMH